MLQIIEQHGRTFGQKASEKGEEYPSYRPVRYLRAHLAYMGLSLSFTVPCRLYAECGFEVFDTVTLQHAIELSGCC